MINIKIEVEQFEIIKEKVIQLIREIKLIEIFF